MPIDAVVDPKKQKLLLLKQWVLSGIAADEVIADSFGASIPPNYCLKKFGLTAEGVTQKDMFIFRCMLRRYRNIVNIKTCKAIFDPDVPVDTFRRYSAQCKLCTGVL